MLVITTIVLFLFEHVSAIAVLGQCGGVGWTGTGVCDSGTACVVVNYFYSQCQPRSGSGTLTATSTSSGTPQPTPYPVLNKLWVQNGKKFWGINTDSYITDTLNFAPLALLVQTDLGAIASESSMQWNTTESTRGNFTFGSADALVNWATSNGKLFRGRALVWHSQLPSWVSSITDKNTLTSVIQNHIATVAGRYKGKIYCIEILNENGSLRSSIFNNVLGESFVTIAFAAAKAADSGARLYITDYNMDSNNAKTQGMIRLITRINASVKYIDGVGSSVHTAAGGAGGLQDALTALASTGVEVAIVDLQINAGSVPDYLTVMRACLHISKCVSITQWDATALWDSAYKPNSLYKVLTSELAPLSTAVATATVL